MRSPIPSQRVVATWCDLDRAAALLPADRDVIDASISLRLVILDFIRQEGLDEELYDACASLGRMIAHHFGSATLASCTIDHALRALQKGDATWLGAARAAVVEGFNLALREKARQEALATWDFPNCVVVLPNDEIAVAAGYPSTDPEELSEWAARVAKGAAMQGVRRAFVTGADAARRSIEDALEIMGISLVKARYAGSRT